MEENEFIIEDDTENELTTYSYISNHLCFEYFIGYEVAALLGYKNPAEIIKKNVSKSNQLIFRDYPGVKIPKLDPRVILITRDGVIEILLKTRKRITPDVLHILKKFNIETTNKKCLTKEQQTLSAITNAFKTEKFEDQYKIGKYYLDLYFPEYKIVVECDENGHTDRKPGDERERMDFVNEKLNIDDSYWIRFNPDEYDFDVSKVIGRIYRKIKDEIKEITLYSKTKEEKVLKLDLK
jgi:very-short-patch-repair endonuclease